MDSQKAIARIPPEVFSAVFSLVPDGDHSLNVTRGLWPLGRVCSFWRSILLSDSSLWTDLNISGSLPAGQQNKPWSDYPWRLQVLSEYLSRSVNRSLHVTIGHAHSACYNCVQKFYRTLYAQSHRFASLSLCTPETLRQLTLPDVFNFPNLRHLTITLPVSFPFHSIMLHSPTLETCCISFDDFTSDPPDQPLRVQSTNNLRELTLKGKVLAGRVPIAAFQLASTSLTSLTINDLSLSLSIIQALPQTQKLCIITRTACSEDTISSLVELIEHRLDCGVMQHVTFSGPICEHNDVVFWGKIDALNARNEVNFALRSSKSIYS